MNGAACTGMHCMLANRTILPAKLGLRLGLGQAALLNCLLCNTNSAAHGPAQLGKRLQFSCAHASSLLTGHLSAGAAHGHHHLPA